MLPLLIEHTNEDIYQKAQALGLPFGYVSTPEDYFKNEQLQYRGYFHEVDHPVAGTLRYPSMGAHFTDGLWESKRAPLLGEHTLEVLESLGHDAQSRANLSAAGALGAHPHGGVTNGAAR